MMSKSLELVVDQPDERAAKRERVADAALIVFQRYGFARTTMSDIAEAVGMSRPALYLLFPNKEEIFAAAVLSANARNLREIQSHLASMADLEQQLTYACQAWIGGGYDRVRQFPDARDMTDLPLPPVQEAYAAFQRLLAGLLADAAAGARWDVTAEDLARLLVAAMRGFKGEAVDRGDLDRMIALEVSAVVSALEHAGPIASGN
ncbi:MAG: TetR/AcrR family transcriptional regulator [Chloroflexia bacterium]|nr:TetR/AcrR family transcriptional regulator [Chloroflexia bacterium]